MKENYENCTDEELIIRLREGENAITDFLMEKYKNLVRKQAASMYILGGEGEDLIQEGMIGLFKALRDYDSGRDASFYTFADLCITRQIYTAVEASGRKKHAPLNYYVSLYGNHGTMGENEEQGYETEFMNSLMKFSEKSPEDQMIDRENLEALELRIQQQLSHFEKQVLDLYLTGMNYTQIARVLGKDEKSTDNALQRIRQKLKR